MTTLFDIELNRFDSGSYKWNEIDTYYGNRVKDAIALSVADMEFKSPSCIADAIAKLTQESLYGYTSPTESYFDAAISWFQRHHQWQVEKEWFSLVPGVVPAINHCVRAFTNENDKVIIQTPVYYPFKKAIENNNRIVAANPLLVQDDKYVMDFDGLEKLASDPQTKLLILCSPHNPVGRVWTPEELNKVADICLRHNVLIASDEIHFDIVQNGFKHTVLANISESVKMNSIILTAPSKTFNMAGIQCSNIITPNPELKALFDAELQKSGLGMLNQFAYAACEAVYTHGEDWLKSFKNQLEKNIILAKDFFNTYFPEFKVFTLEGTYLLWVDFSSLGKEHQELEYIMKDKAHVFLDEGYIFGIEGEKYERFNLACPEQQLTRALMKIKDALSDYKK